MADKDPAPLLARYQHVIFAVLVLFIVLGMLALLLARPAPVVIDVQPPPPTPLPLPTATPASIQVYISGAVAAPDVYRLAFGANGKDALEAAGGPTDDADLSRVNLAARLVDEQHLHIPAVDEPARVVTTQAGGAKPEKININTAGAARLQELPGIGPARARDIISYREVNGPFERIEDIVNVSGIGDVTFAGMADLITVD